MSVDPADLDAYEAERDWARQQEADMGSAYPPPEAQAPPELEAAEMAAEGRLADKVHDLLEQKRVLLSVEVPGARRQRRVYAYVMGDHEPYVVQADERDVRCSCWAARMGQECAHRLAAMAAWSELDG